MFSHDVKMSFLISSEFEFLCKNELIYIFLKSQPLPLMSQEIKIVSSVSSTEIILK